MKKHDSLAQAEQEALTSLLDPLAAHQAVCERVFNTLGLAVSALPEDPIEQVPVARAVCANLVIRLSNELRCVGLLAARGYAMQAASLVATVWEVSHTIAVIGADEERAKDWVEHDDPKHSYEKANKLAERVVAQLDGVADPKGMVANAYRVYGEFCQAKHANPMLQQHHGFYETAEGVVMVTGPETSEKAIELAKKALKATSQLASIGLASFYDSHVPEGEQRRKVQHRMQAIREEITALQ